MTFPEEKGQWNFFVKSQSGSNYFSEQSYPNRRFAMDRKKETN